jgi:hypothetical protein
VIPRRRLILHAATRVAVFLVAFTLAAYLLADLIALLVDHAPHVGTLLIGWMLGVLTVAVVGGHDRRRSAAVITQLPRSVLLARTPSGPAVPTKWRSAVNGHRRYGLGRDEQ